MKMKEEASPNISADYFQISKSVGAWTDPIAVVNTRNSLKIKIVRTDRMPPKKDAKGGAKDKGGKSGAGKSEEKG